MKLQHLRLLLGLCVALRFQRQLDAAAALKSGCIPEQVRTLYVREMVFGAYMIICALLALRNNSHWGFSVYLTLQVLQMPSLTRKTDGGQLLSALCLRPAARP